jgi:hypothetical protein
MIVQRSVSNVWNSMKSINCRKQPYMVLHTSAGSNAVVRNNITCKYSKLWGRDSSVGIVTERAGRSGDRIPVGARFFAHVQTGPGAHPASSTMGTGSFPVVKRPGRGADHPPPSNAEVKKEKSYTSTPLWAFGSVTGYLNLYSKL